MLLLRRIGLVVIALAAVGVFLALEPEPPEATSLNLSPTNYETLVNIALADYEENASRTDTAPQQQVVNGWVARDLLRIQTLVLVDLLDAVSEENSSGQLVAASDPRVPALLTLAVIAISLIGITSERSANETTNGMAVDRHPNRHPGE